MRIICTCLLALTVFVSGCSKLGMSNPFASAEDVTEYYTAQFSDIMVPVDMKMVPSGTMVTPTQDGIKVGLETYQGRVDASSLASAMIHNMVRHGWSLRGSVTGKRTMQLHEKDQRFAVIYIYPGTLKTTMELWVLNRLNSGFSSLEENGFSPAPVTNEAASIVIQELAK